MNLHTFRIRPNISFFIKFFRVNYINGHYGLSVFADLVAELFFHQVQSLRFQIVTDSVNLSDHLCNFSKTTMTILCNEIGMDLYPFETSTTRPGEQKVQ